MQRSGAGYPNGSPTTRGGHDPRRCGGVVAAVLTPCRSPGEPDPAAMRTLCGRLAAGGCDGLFVISSTGEMPMLDGDDRQTLIAAARAGADGATLYAGISGTGLAQALRYTRQAAEAGADVAIAMPPFFLKLNQRELLAYFTAIADASPIPVGLYHHLRMPSVIEVATVARLAGHPNIVVMKDTSINVDRVQATASAVPRAALALMQGREPLIFASLQAGASGCVTALAGVVPEWHRALMDAWSAGDEAAAADAQARIDRLAELFSLPEVGQSFAHFAYVLRRAVWRRGWLACTDGMVPGFKPDPGLNARIDQVLGAAGLPVEAEAAAGRE